MRFSFRAKLMTVVGISALAFAVLIVAEVLLTNRMERQLATIQEHYIPIMEMGPRLEADFDRLHRGFQDSVAAQDREALKKMSELKDHFLSGLEAAKNVIDSEYATALRNGIEDYYSSAYDVSSRLISGETGVTFVNAMTLMQTKQVQVASLLEKAVALDRGKLIVAFSTIAATQSASGRILAFISVLCLLIVSFISLGLSQSVLRALSELSGGLRRFGQGDFSLPIEVASRDELGDVAKEANQMASRIKGLLKELESFSYSVAHDLRAPLRAILGFSTIVMDDFGPALPEEARSSLERVTGAAQRMGLLIDSLLNFSRLTRKEIKKESVDLSALIQTILGELQESNPDRKLVIDVEKNVVVRGDSQLLQIVFMNLLGNAWKFTSKKAETHIGFGMKYQEERKVYFVRDNGAGFDMQYASKLFGTFQRLHKAEEFEGTGIGLATVQNIINRHGGEIWAEAKPDQGAVFYFTL